MGGGRRKTETRLIHPDAHASRDFEAVPTPIYRASTVFFDSLAEAFDHGEDHYRYGVNGTPTTRELELRMAGIEGAAGCILAPSGLAAIALTYIACCRPGDHALLPASAYAPNSRIARFLADFGIDVQIYDPCIGAGIESLVTDRTRLIWCESPGSISMEVQDIPAICKIAARHDILVAVDNSYAAGLLFNPLTHGADLSVHALTKYPGGHGDVLMGCINARSDRMAKKMRDTARLLGICVSPDDAALVLRGLPSMAMRIAHVERQALDLARWMRDQPCVEKVLHPAFPDCPGHEIWKRDFSGSAGIFSVIFLDWSRAQVEAFVDSLELFRIGYSWGGPVSLAMAYRGLDRPTPEKGARLVRFSVGFEDVEDLRADLARAIERASG
ncbi:cystathionine beta-lyase [Sphingomicrobium lutaoense]|uniref:Cystathionine beta-lyase n=1 Tax=Sphingomicrobium lutaoense TaxID=515949 RepID=A0A839Z4X3_9SPHN|nr:cystathionine beta-lyase [Sphingomicrobium lutaoense]MBB3763714.1 cystathionine beta-lyase [Sphingomicrobium lutaoense]